MAAQVFSAAFRQAAIISSQATGSLDWRDFTWTNIRGIGSDPFFGGKNGGEITLATRTDWLASATGRLGYAWDRLLVYGKGGAAWARDDYRLQNLIGLNANYCVNGGFVACNPSGSTDRFGWTAGAGFEWAFTDNWSALVEYDHHGFDRKSVGFSDPSALTTVPGVLSVKQDVDVVKVGLNYRFWSSGSAVAR